MTEPSKQTAASFNERQVLMKLVSLVTPAELPKSFFSLHNRVWEAFDLGRQYEKEVTHQWLKDQREKA